MLNTWTIPYRVGGFRYLAGVREDSSIGESLLHLAAQNVRAYLTRPIAHTMR